MAADKPLETIPEPEKPSGTRRLSTEAVDSFADRFDKADRANADSITSSGTLLAGESKSATPVRPADGVKPEAVPADTSKHTTDKPGAVIPGAAHTDGQQPKDAGLPSGRPQDRSVEPANRVVDTPRASEQTRGAGDVPVPKTQNQDVLPANQRPAEVSPQPVAKAPEPAPEKVSSASAELPSDRAHLPGLAIVGPESKAQPGSVPSLGTSDGKVHDPVIAKVPEQSLAKPSEQSGAKSQDGLPPKTNDTGLRGGELGQGALTGKVQAGPDRIKTDDVVRPAGQLGDAAQRQPNGASVLKNLQGDGTRSGIDHTNQGIVAKGVDGKIDAKAVDLKNADSKDGVRSGQVPLTEGKIADGKGGIDRGQIRLPDGRPEGKIADGAAPNGRPGEVKLGDGKIADGKTGDGKTSDGKSVGGKAGDGKVPEGKVGGGTSAPGFIQFIENQAGIRGFGVPAKSEGSKDSTGGKAQVGDTKSGAGIPGAKSNPLDGFLGLVETVKDNIKGSIKNLGDRSQPALPLKEGELAAVALRGKMPPLRDDITSVQIIAVLIPKGFVSWSIVKAPGMKPSDSPIPAVPGRFPDAKATDGKPTGLTVDGKLGTDKSNASNSSDSKQTEIKPGESKPFDINNPEVKTRPFIQLHGVDSNYTGPGARRPEPVAPVRAEQVKVDQVKVDQVKADQVKVDQIRPDQVRPEPVKPNPVKGDPLTDTKIAATAAGALPYIDVSNNNQIVDQSSTRKSIQLDPKERQRLIEEQEQTLQSDGDSDLSSDKGNEKDKDVESILPELTPVNEGEKRLRYVNAALDAQEETWNSADEEANNKREMPAPLGRYTYIVQDGDTIESVAVVELNDLTLAPLLFSKNKKYVLPEVEYGRHPLTVGAVIDLPTPAEIKAFRGF